MANTKVILKKSGVTGNTPGSLQHGELAINYADGLLFYKNANNVISTISGGGGGSTAEPAIEHQSYTGNGSSNSFNLGAEVSSDAVVIASINGVIQDPSVYSVDGSVIIFNTTPSSNDNIDLRTFYSYSSSVKTNYAALTNTNADQIVDTYNKTEYRTAKYLMQAVQGSNVHCTEVILTHNDTDVYKNEYGTMWTNNSLITVSATIDSNNINLVVTPMYINTKIDVARISLAARTLT
jgi:hypothetical protein